MTDSPNYCQHPECHNSHIVYYADYYWNEWPLHRRGTWISLWPPTRQSAHLWRRWCWSHAWINEGVAFG